MKDFIVGFHEMLARWAEEIARANPAWAALIRLAPLLIELAILVLAFQKIFAVVFGRSEPAPVDDPHVVRLPRDRLSNGKMIEARLNEDGSIKGWVPYEDPRLHAPPRIERAMQPTKKAGANER